MSTAGGHIPSVAQALAPVPAPNGLDTPRRLGPLPFIRRLHAMITACTNEGTTIASWNEDGTTFIFEESEDLMTRLNDSSVCTSNDLGAFKRNLNAHGFKTEKSDGDGNRVTRIASRQFFTRMSTREDLRKIDRKPQTRNNNVVEVATASAVMNNTGGNATPSGVKAAPELTVTRDEFDSIQQRLDALQKDREEDRKLLREMLSSWASTNGQKPEARVRAVTDIEENTLQKRSRPLSGDDGQNHCLPLNITAETGGGRSPPQKKLAKTDPRRKKKNQDDMKKSSTSDLLAGRKYGLSGITPHNDHCNSNEDSSGANSSFSNGQASGLREVNMKPSSEKTLARSVSCRSESNTELGGIDTSHSRKAARAGFEQKYAASTNHGLIPAASDSFPSDDRTEEKQSDQDNMEESLDSTSPAGEKCDVSKRGPPDDLSTCMHSSECDKDSITDRPTENDIVCIVRDGNLCYEDFLGTQEPCYPGNIWYDSKISAMRQKYSRSNEKIKKMIVTHIVDDVHLCDGRFLKTDDDWLYAKIQEDTPAIKEMTKRALEKWSAEDDGKESNLNGDTHGHNNGESSRDDDYGGDGGNSGPSMDGSTGSSERGPEKRHGGGSPPSHTCSSALGHNISVSKGAVDCLGTSAARGAQLMEDENSDYPVNNEARPIVAFPPAIVLSCTRIDDARVRPSDSVGEDMIRFPSMAVVSPSAVPTVIRGNDKDDGSHAVDYPQGRHRKARAYAFVKKLGESVLGEIWVAILAHQLSSQSDKVAEGQSGAEWEFGSLSEYFAVKRVPIANISLEDCGTSEDPIREVQAMQYFRRWYEKNFHKKQSGKVETPYKEAVRIMAETNVMIPVDVLADESYLYIVMPYCSGGDLFDALNLSNKPCMGEEASRAFMTQVLNGLEHLQKAGLAHRDISMENILLHNGSCIIADMGQCVRVPSKGQRRCLIDHSDGALIGKSEYRPPEVWKNENYDGFAMDIWCLSITLFIALTGTYPGDSILDKCFWEGSSNRESFELGSGERKNLEETVMMCLPDGAFDLLQKCLEEDPRRRLSLQQIRDHPWMARSIKASDSPSAPTSSLCPAASVSREKVIEKVAPKTDSSSSGASKCSHKHSLSSEDAEAKLDAASKMARAVKKLAADSAVSSISYKDLEMDSSRISSYKEDSEGFALEGTSAEVQAQTDVTEKVLLRKDVFSKDNLKELGGTTRVENTREINTIIEAMRKNRQSETVQVQSCAALRDLADFNFFNCAAIGKAEGIPTVVEAMTAHQQSVRVQEAACAALRNLSSQCYHNIAAIREAGGIPAIIQAMTAHQQSVRVQEEACRALRSLAVHIKDAVCEAGGIPVIVRAMTTHVLSEEVQENACAALRLLSVNYDNAVAIREGGGISAIVQAMAAHHESDKVQYQACTALGHLANRNEENEAAIREAGGVRQIKMAKEKHAGSAEVKRAADYALKERRLERVNMRKSIRR